jgi:hypothetical protein
MKHGLPVRVPDGLSAFIGRLFDTAERRFNMQQSLSKIINKFQNYSHKFSIIDAVTDISVASDFTTHQ